MVSVARTRKKEEKKPGREQTKKTAGKTSAPLKRHRPEAVEGESSALLDDSTKRDIAGISCIVLAVIFMLLVALPADGALVSSIASEWMRLIFGVGAYMLPFILAGIGATFLFRSQRQRVPARAAVGLTILFIALLGLIATFTPTAALGVEDVQLLFLESNLTSHGGYIGAGLAFCLISLFGKLISWVFFVGLMIIGAVIVGFSISKTLERIRVKKRQLAERHSGDLTGMLSSKRLRVRKADDVPMRGEIPYAQDELPFDEGANVTRPLVFAEVTPPSEDDPAARRIQAARELLGDPASAPMSGVEVSPRFQPAPEEEEPEAFESALTQEVFHPLPNLDGFEEDEASEEEEVRPFEEADFARLKGWKGSDTLRIPKIDTGAVKLEGLPRIEQPLRVEEWEEPEKPEKPEEEELPPSDPKEAPKKAKVKPAAAPVERGGFMLPDMSLLAAPTKPKGKGRGSAELQETAHTLQQTLEDFGISAQVVGWIEGPTVTLFKVDLPAGVRVSRITNLNDDIALALASPGVRIFAPIPGTNHVGIEIPNKVRQTVLLSDVLGDAQEGPLQIAIGKDVEGHSIISDLARMPHLLIGGTTGSGKSVSINAMIMSILMRATPDEVRFIMIDPKRVEFTPYNGIPHLYVPVVTEPKEASNALSWGVAEMERRLKVFSKLGVRNITQYNDKVRPGGMLDAEGRELECLPYIVIIIDELADLMMNVGKEVEFSISRIAQLARAAGIHLIVATQRPSTNVVTGLIKANITNRIAFNVASGIDSRVILDTPGAENLIGLGDMLLSKPELPKPQRIQACFVSEEEIENVVEFVKSQGEPEYHSDILQVNLISLGDSSPQGGTGNVDDPLVWEAADIVVSSRMGSTSNIQRRLKVGYARAGRIMDQLEELGVVGPANGSKPREVLIDELELETLRAFEENDQG